jgi:hypothetical protein
MKNENRLTRYLALTALGVSGAGIALAQEPNPYYIGVSQAFTRESNLFRVAEGQPETKDTYSTTSLLAGVNQPFGRQRFFGDAVVGYNRYQDSSQLNHTAYGVGVGLDWETIESLSGRLGYTVKENLARYGADQGPQTTALNLERSQEFIAQAQYGKVSLLSVEGSFVHRQLDYSAPEFAVLEFRQDAVRLGLLYRPSGLLTLGAAGRHTKGEYPFAIETAPGSFQSDPFTRDDFDLTAVWVPTGDSTVRVRISYTKEDHDVVISRNLTNWTGSVGWDYKPTGKLAFRSEVFRDTGAESAFNGLAQTGTNAVGNYSALSTTVSIRAQYEVTAKIQLEASGRYVERDLVSFGAATQTTGTDRLGQAKLGLTWTPTRSLTFGCFVGWERRGTSSPLSYPYTTDLASCLGQFKLQ